VSSLAVEPTFQMWIVMAVIAVAVIAYVNERLSLELTSISVVAFLVLFFHLFPVTAADGRNLLDARILIAGLADPALIAVLALLVVGQGMVQTGALEEPARRLAVLRRHRPFLTVAISLAAAALISAFLNNTPVVVIFIPLMTALASRVHRSVSTVMMPLSFACILGGMTTMIGSSTNLMAASAAQQAGARPIGFFDFTLPGTVLAVIGLVYVVWIAPRLLPDRASLADTLVGPEGKQFIVEFVVAPDTPLVGRGFVAGRVADLPDVTVRLVQRGEEAILPPFDDVILRPGDEIVVAATRKAIMEAFSASPELFTGALTGSDVAEAADTDTGGEVKLGSDLVLAEVVVAPASRIIGRNLKQVVFHHRTGCIVLGIQRRSRMIRQTMTDIRLDAGDVLLIMGPRHRVEHLRGNPDVILLEWSARDMPAIARAHWARIIFGSVVVLAASGLVPVVAAALTGAVAMLMTGCLNIHQAQRALDRRVALLIWAALAMGAALRMTGGAQYLADTLIDALAGAPAAVILSALFLLIALLTNVLSNNATAVLFTPIAIGIADGLGVSQLPFIYAVIFAANCSFASPVGYQTNLLVMGPGHYRFTDFARAGLPLIFIIWLSYSLLAPWYFGL